MSSSQEEAKVRIRLHPIQNQFRRSAALYRGFTGGRGSGKSWVGAFDILMRARKGRSYMIASPTSVLMGDTTLPTFKALAQTLGMWNPYKIRMTPYPTMELTTGAIIKFRTAEDPDKMRGPNLSGVWLDEASLMHEDAYKIAIACLREGGEQGWLSSTFTPKGLSHWTYEVFAKEPRRANTELFHCKTGDNPFLPKEFEKTLRTQYVGMFAQQELDGLFLSIEGAEWPSEFFDGILFDDWPPDICTRVMALDPSKGKADRSGDYSAWIMLGVDRDGCLWVDADIDNARPVEQLASNPGQRSIVSDGYELYRGFGPTAVLVETNGFQEMVATALYRYAVEKGVYLPIYTVNHNIPKAQRIRTLTPFLSQKRLRVRNTRGGQMLIQQMRDFPVGEHDDGPDALAASVEMANRLIFGEQDGNKVHVLVT